MSIVIDHDERRRVILANAMALFAEEGYAGVTYQKIAARSGVARTGIYKYFRTKREILDHAIRRLTDDLLRELAMVSEDSDRPVAARLETVLSTVLTALFRLRAVLTIILEYLLRQQQDGDDTSRRVRRHTVGMRLLLRQLVREGIQRGELAAVRPGDAADMLLALLEAVVLDVTVGGMLDHHQAQRLLTLALRRLQAGGRNQEPVT
jgi:AcrR family transcriptional regulator